MTMRFFVLAGGMATMISLVTAAPPVLVDPETGKQLGTLERQPLRPGFHQQSLRALWQPLQPGFDQQPLWPIRQPLQPGLAE